MSGMNFGTRSDWLGEKHGPWRRGAGALKLLHVQRLPIRPQFNTGRTPRHAVLDLARLLAAEPMAWDLIDLMPTTKRSR